MAGIGPMLAGLAAAAALLAPSPAAADAVAGEAQSAVFAIVEGTAISAAEFEGALAAAIRRKFYHRQPREDQLAALRSEVTDELVNRVLLLKEAQRRGIRADEEKVRAELAAYEQRVRDSPQWRKVRSEVLPALTRALRERNAIAQLEAAIRAVPPPGEAELRAYYESHPELFTEPERVRLSLILLKVDPASPADAWERAFARARELLAQLANGADFAELARQHSGDASASDGGDMGYRHRGMLSPHLESEIAKLAVGATSEPIKLLEGVAIFRVTERRPPELKKLEHVRRAATELWAREQGEARWRELIARLRAGAEIRIGDERAP